MTSKEYSQGVGSWFLEGCEGQTRCYDGQKFAGNLREAGQPIDASSVYTFPQ